jgi:hypothetical protein
MHDLHETYQRQLDAMQEAQNQQLAAMLQYMQNLGHVVAPQVQLPPPPQVLVAPPPRPAALSPVSCFPTKLCSFVSRIELERLDIDA